MTSNGETGQSTIIAPDVFHHIPSERETIDIEKSLTAIEPVRITMVRQLANYGIVFGPSLPRLTTLLGR